ncbi:aminotransferase class I/II-fold pyridoxal phosphate-dependent enzyme [Kineosporia sp. J2-2]|uniref:cysteine-S-conjugate beta-lyase n=1 Tax=Kineosporia corallincola TaxID=2835133 RepID=A0ABS5TH53_9ACTN|nr:aminotransferase class I/II-fold pyridoxal phosphate-dependent enzyme [Kineosporia corallincola]MBT0769378.1 aminotransferase class I/II-fold pyridoxal phosphate-dependent enzyme [Kineosporia corallincola]
MSDLRVPDDDYIYFVGRALDGIRTVVGQLGDEHVNRRPRPTANSPFGLVTHCLGVMDYWCGTLIAGRRTDRDRDAEFTATGSAAQLLTAIDDARTRFLADLTHLRSDDPPAVPPDPAFQGPERPLTQGGVLLHVYEELAQHHGQLEGLRDELTAHAVPDFEPSLTWLRARRSVKWHRPGPDLLPTWVADMDFPVAPVVRRAVLEVLDRGDLGYPDHPDGLDPLAETFAHRMHRRFGWHAEPEKVRGITDLLAGLQILLDLTTRPGDGVILQEPNYPPFRATVPTMRRRALNLPLVLDGGTWRHDFERLPRDFSARVLLLVNPHNPTGTAFELDELHRLANFALRHDLLVISDEIHADLVHDPHRHIPFATLGPEIASRTVTLTSATKAFNIAGLRTALAHIGPDRVRQRWDGEPPDIHGVANVLGVEATRAAWEHGDGWLDGVRAHLLERRDQLATAVKTMPGVRLRVPDATYLAWLDCSGALPGQDAAAFLERRARVFAGPGPDYGGAPEWTRLNFATSTEVLGRITRQIGAALENP